jgi:hypothetical protein
MIDEKTEPMIVVLGYAMWSHLLVDGTRDAKLLIYIPPTLLSGFHCGSLLICAIRSKKISRIGRPFVCRKHAG